MGKEQKSSKNLSTEAVVPIALDAWEVQPVDLDAWSVEETSEEVQIEKPKSKVQAIAQPVAVSIDDWADPEAISIDDWTTSDETSAAVASSESLDNDASESFSSSASLVFEQLDESIEDPRHPVQAEAVDLESEALSEDIDLPDETFDSEVDAKEDVGLDVELDIESEEEIDFDEAEALEDEIEREEELEDEIEALDAAMEDDGISVHLSPEERDLFEPDENDIELDLIPDSSLTDEELEGPIEMSDNIFDEEPEKVTPTQTKTIEVKFSSKDLSENLELRDGSEDTSSPLITTEEDLGLEIDDLDLPGSEPEDLTPFNISDNGDFNHDVELDDEDDGYFDLKTVATIIQVPEESAPNLDIPEPEESQLNNSDAEVQEKSPDLSIDPIPAVASDNTLPEMPVEVSREETDRIALTALDLAQNHQLPVIQLGMEDLRENNQLAVILLNECDLASNHRVIVELSEDFFTENNILFNLQGIILLQEMDLAIVEDVAEEIVAPKKTRTEKTRNIREVKASNWNEQKLIRWCLIAMPLLILGSILGFHFKYSWTTISEAEYQKIKASTPGFDWYYEKMFRYRTQDSSWRWYGQQKLKASAYEKKSEENFFAWFSYDNSGRENIGDSIDE